LLGRTPRNLIRTIEAHEYQAIVSRQSIRWNYFEFGER
jgi:hypothetical protein